MSKIKTKELLKEVTNHIQNIMGYEVVDSFSDFEGKYSIVVEIPHTPNPNQKGIQYVGKKYKPICEFGVFKNSQKEDFIIWDYRENQPFEKGIHCVNSDFGVGRYEFTNRESFYNHINSDFGLTIFDRMRLDNKTEINLNK